MLFIARALSVSLVLFFFYCKSAFCVPSAVLPFNVGLLLVSLVLVWFYCNGTVSGSSAVVILL